MIVAGDQPQGLNIAAHAIRDGQLVGLPTETVYGLAADAENPQAVEKIFKAKGRPADHPLIIHVHDRVAASHFASHIPEFAHALMRAFWPGPLTVILHRRASVAEKAAGGHATVGLRCPSHPVAQALLAQLSRVEPGSRVVHGLAAPSANMFGRVSPTKAEHVVADLGSDLVVLDGGDCAVGIESTILDCSREQPVLLRPGVITVTQLEVVCGTPVLTAQESSNVLGAAPKASGTLASHYAPSAKVRLMDSVPMLAALRERVQSGELMPLAVWVRSFDPPAEQGLLVQRMPENPEEAARQLFATLRHFDTLGVKEIWIEPVPSGDAWEGVRDRLVRAAHT